tara:strand:+ start:336 stop:527 length:192 start_codon:yes stop_codon:yes gene_type:complete
MSSVNDYWGDCPTDDDELPPIPSNWTQKPVDNHIKKVNNNTKKTTNINTFNPFSILLSDSDSD